MWRGHRARGLLQAEGGPGQDRHPVFGVRRPQCRLGEETFNSLCPGAEQFELVAESYPTSGSSVRVRDYHYGYETGNGVFIFFLKIII